jgi:hypothetical protein
VTGGALVAGVNARAYLTIESFSQNTSGRSLTYPPGSSEQKGMGNSLLGDGILQGLSDGPLPNNIFKDLGSPFSC